MPADMIGAVVDGWEITGKLGEGAMGEVYEARRGNRRAAIKVAHPNNLSPDSLERFRREANILMELDHPHVVNCLAAGESDGFIYLALEYMEGGTLQDLISRNGPLELPKAVYVTRRVLQGLAAVHERKIIHRDLKPDNVLLDVRGRPKLADFSLARAKAHAGITGANTILGTMDYMSPEQCRVEDVDHRADLYAVGAMLYHLVVGEPPYSGRSGLAVLQKHLNDSVPDVVKKLPSAKPVRNAIRKLMAKDRAQRPADAKAALKLLDGLPEERLFDDDGATPTRGYVPLREPGPSRLLDLLALVVIAAGVGVAVHAQGHDLVTLTGVDALRPHLERLTPHWPIAAGVAGVALLDRVLARVRGAGILGGLGRLVGIGR